MPMGITAAIYEGEDVSVRDYLMGVGRQMGFAIMQRDESMAEPVKPVEPHTSYYDEQIQNAEARLAELDAMTEAQADRAAREDHAQKLKAWQDRRDEKQALRERYEAMVEKVEAWEPDPLIAETTETKELALKYLRESIEFDCDKPGDTFLFDSEPQPVTGDLWLTGQRLEAERNLKYGIDHRREELERVEERNRYISAFLRSLPEDGK